MRRFVAVALFLTAAKIAAQPCEASQNRLCLNGGRFAAEVSWKDFQGNTGAGRAVALTGDTGFFWFFNSANIELVVKVLDGTGVNGHFWVFYGALSNVEYTMTVTDTQTGAVQTYANPLGHLGSVADTAAFAGVSAGVSAVQPAQPARSAERGRQDRIAPVAEAGLDRVKAAAVTCTPTATSLCLNQGRFRAEVTWRDFDGNAGDGQAIALTSDSGYFWFFNAANVELVVKALDGRGVNGDFWVFFGALSTVEYQLEITDTVTGRTRYYFNPSRNLTSIADTKAIGDGTVVQTVHDASHAVTQSVPTTGGTLAATAADGSRFTLEIPSGAFLSDQDVTLTPVTSIGGLPLSGGLAAAVHIEPEGLVLYEAATLTIEPAVSLPVDQAITFSYQGDGAEFFLQPPLPAAGVIQLPVLHLSGYGVGRGTQADIDAQALRLPTLSVDQFAQKLAVSMLPQLRSGAFGSSRAPGGARPLRATVTCGQQVGDQFRATYQAVVVPLLASVVGDCNMLRQKTPELRWFVNYAKALGCASELSVQIASVQAVILNEQKRCYNDAYTKCHDNRDASQAAEIGFWETELERDGNVGQVDLTKLKRCLSFELTFESTIDATSDDLGEVRLAFTSHLATPASPNAIPVRFNDQNVLTGGGTLKYLSVQFTGKAETSCTVTATPLADSSFTVSRLHFVVSPSLDYVKLSPPELRLDYLLDLLQPSESLRKVCQSPPEDGTAPVTMWRDAFDTAHASEEPQGVGGPIRCDLVVVGSHAQYAGKLYQYPSKTFPNESPLSSTRHIAETTAITVFHTPQ